MWRNLFMVVDLERVRTLNLLANALQPEQTHTNNWARWPLEADQVQEQLELQQDVL